MAFPRTVFLSLLAASALSLSAPAQNAAPPTNPPAPADLQKQLDDAIKLLDKLDPSKTDDAKKQLEDIRKQIVQMPVGGFGGIAIGGFGGVNGPFNNINGALNGIPFNIAGLGMPNPRLGATTRPVEKTLEAQLKLTPNQGQVIAELGPNSPVAKAGIKQYDILLEIDGKAVPGDPLEFQKSINDVKADTEVTATVLRAGKKETIKGLKLPEGDFPIQNNPFGVPQIQIVPGAFPFPLPGGLPGGAQGLPPGFPGGLPGGVAPAFPGLPAPPIQIAPQGGAIGGPIQIQAGAIAVNGGEATAVAINNDGFSINHSSGALKIEIKGKQENGKSTPSEIKIEDGATTVRAQSVAQVPEMYRATVNKLLDNVK